MNRKIVSALLILMIVLTTAGWTSTQNPKVLLVQAIMNTMDINSAEQDVNMYLSLDFGGNSDLADESLTSALKDVAVKFHTKTILEDTPKIAMDASAELSGMTYNAELYMTEDQLIMKIPMIEQYLVQDMTTEDTSMIITKKESNMFQMKVYGRIFSMITDEELVMEEGATAEINGEEVEVTNISMSFDDARTKAMLKDIYLTALKDETYRDMMINAQKKEMTEYGVEVTEEEILSELDSMVAELEMAWDEAMKHITFDTFKLSYSISEDKYIVDSIFEADMTVIEPETQENIQVSISYVSELYNINKIDALEYPQLTDENSMSFEELSSMGY